jgi:hypothetical protein
LLIIRGALKHPLRSNIEIGGLMSQQKPCSSLAQSLGLVVAEFDRDRHGSFHLLSNDGTFLG